MDVKFSFPSAACEKDAEALQFIEDMTSNADNVQQNVLAEILSQNGNAEYLQKFQVEGAIIDRETYKSKVPVVVYEDIQPFIKRIANGDRSPILSTRPISEFLTSSGTSGGESNLMPVTQEELPRRRKLYSLLMPVMNLYVPGLEKGKCLYFLFVKAETKTPGGLLARPDTTSYYNSDMFKNKLHDPYSVHTSPTEAILCLDSFQSMYTQMLCGLIKRDEVNRVGAVFASGLVRAIRFLQLNWRQLANDISTGILNPEIKDPSVIKCMSKVLKPNTDLAEFITKECENENWEGIISRIWPKTKYLDVVVTGAMAQYIPTLDYYSGGLPKASTMYASSECYFGLNLKPMCNPSEVSFTIMPNMGYFEFLPLDDHIGQDPPQLVDLGDVEVGKEYELIITTYSGLCRYRVGDILKVTGFHNSAPQFKFIRRKNVLLSIDVDKTDEAELQKAVENVSKLLAGECSNATITEYTSFADTKSIPGHYVIYLELLVKDPNNWPCDQTLEQCCFVMEESLNSVYKQCRNADNSIGALEIRIVKNGTFEEVMDYAISRGASINQYKAPRCVNFTPIVELLDSRVISIHFSPAMPLWSPERKH
ncbi:hypothetical protein LIER_23223 [Lithospermum erythrorhizon]|uniref:Uncharacterized protein n=1 Tax=Lithospermum erythrorhizon TaxID=34254 RepID=A0AAV3R293_LITER